MREYNRNAYLFSLHIPKTAGTSFTELLKSWFWPGFHAHYYDHQFGKMPLNIRPVKKILHSLGIYPLCIHGHFEEEAGVYESYPLAEQFITIIRDPLEMQISLFYDHQRRLKEEGQLYWKGEPVVMEYGGDLDHWVEERPSYLLKFFPWEMNESNFTEVLAKHFIHIGVTEKLQQSVAILAEKLGKKPQKVPHLNKSKRDRMPSNSSIQKFREKHHLEYLIYEFVLNLNY